MVIYKRYCYIFTPQDNMFRDKSKFINENLNFLYFFIKSLH